MYPTPATAFALCALALALGSCAAPGPAAAQRPTSEIVWQPDLPVAQAPFDALSANWKQRLDQPYVYVELRGSYTRIGRALEQADRAMRDQGIEACGPPFALYYDDPGEVSADQLTARACFPVRGPVAAAAPLACDLLAGTTVVYAFVGGPYPEVPRAYPALLRYMRSLSWRETGPIREVYLVNPAEVADYSQLVCEVQIPAASRP